MRKRDFKDIAFIDNKDGTLEFRNLISEMIVPYDGGGYILATGCGVGKSTSINSLVKLFDADGFVIFEKSQVECDEVKAKLIEAGVAAADIKVLHANSSGYDTLLKDPESVTQHRVLIMSSIQLYQGFLPAMLAYDGGARVNLESYIYDTPKLMRSDQVRRFVLIDEAPSFIKPFNHFDGIELTNNISTFSLSCDFSGVELPEGGFLNPLPYPLMEQFYFSRVRKSSNKLFDANNALSRFKAKEVLRYIEDNFADIHAKNSVDIYHNLNDLIVAASKCNIYIFDATGAILSNYKCSRFKLIENNDKNYSSPIQFEKFTMTTDRWQLQSRATEETIINEITTMSDELERQINSISGKLLIVTWLYMALRDSNPENESKKIDIISQLDTELQRRSLGDRYSIIYFGSKDDKATNRFSAYEAVTFLGNWKTGTANVKLVNRNLGIKSTELQHRTAGMVQTICRLRIRNHTGEAIKVFYSSDIDDELMSEVFKHFVQNSDDGVKITGVPIFTPDNRDFRWIRQLSVLCNYDSSLFAHIQTLSSYTLSISLSEILKLIPMKEQRSRAYDGFVEWLLEEYNINLLIS